jgi:hypothetical protein
MIERKRSKGRRATSTGARQAPISMYLDRFDLGDSVTSGGVGHRPLRGPCCKSMLAALQHIVPTISYKGFGAITSFRHPSTAPNQVRRQACHL